ncbi:cytochrome P450 [Bradyrhizobium sp. AUGA SZCCT0274]|uniref:cytochrome P450 n=1 Tax=Bradyrhizobium sp. AUGA SZCCT0274 TaxID=2807670 RepID=UPI001BAA6BDB|nr:cytochrome P450 [Bradyrhizobium sp. AUGA SZCCT0274]MBR1240315.1 cytochrome P450 [Bradyrhizobium sp. AUGA SZCCT0274]
MEMMNDAPAAALADPQTFIRDEAHDQWRHLRAYRPVAWTPEPDGPGFWSVTRHGDGERVLRETSLFSSFEGTTLEANRWEDDPAAGKMLPLMTAPTHGELRRILLPYFSGRRLAALETEAAAFVGGLVEDCAAQGRFEVTDMLGTRIPTHIAFGLLGLPESDEAALLPTVRDTLSCDEEARTIADAELLLYIADVVDQRRRRPGDDAISAVVSAQLSVGKLEDEAVLLTVLNLMTAGLTTTRLAITGALHALITHEAQWRWLQTQPEVPGSAVEECLRWTSPAAAVVRTASGDAELGGQRVRIGQRIAVWIPSLNRDESVFDNAGHLRLDRSPNRHLGFGTGVHACLGMVLARLELRLLLDTIRRRWKHLESAGPVERLGSLVLQGIDRLPVRVASA